RPSYRNSIPLYNDSVVMAERYDCMQCAQSLYGQKYILKDDDPFCVKCYEQLFSSSCEVCQKLIHCTSKVKSLFFPRPIFLPFPDGRKPAKMRCVSTGTKGLERRWCTKKMEHRGNSWHENCFACNRCQQPIGTRSFIQKDANNYCLPCYEKQFAMQCVHCKKPITTGGVNYRDQPWHKECFVCTGCKQQLAGQRFTSRDDFAYCLECFCNLFAKKCAACTAPISGLGGSKYISFEQRQWHNDCFNCKRCCVSLVGRGFLTSKEEILCPECVKDF
uniref:LIM zinc-binding domain-containing protein n=1 Tax=Cyclopterus lumpus TaxID=8103 RepID=A0A8C2XQQ5_CYCLU